MTESLEDAVAYYEFDGEDCVRQINDDVGNWQFLERPIGQSNPDVLDLSLSAMLTSDMEEITAEEFESLWANRPNA